MAWPDAGTSARLRDGPASPAAVLVLAGAAVAVAGGPGTARAAQQEPAAEPAPLIQLEVDVNREPRRGTKPGRTDAARGASTARPLGSLNEIIRCRRARSV